MRGSRRGRRLRDLPAIHMLYHLLFLRSAREPKAAFSALAQRLALLGRHWAIRLRHWHAAVRAVCVARRIDRRAVARRRRVVRSRGRRRGAARASGEERLRVAVLAHAAVGTRPGARPGATTTGSGGGSCCCASDAGLVTVRGDLGSREVRGTCMSDYPVRIEVAVKVVVATAVAAPAEQTDEKDGD